MVVFFNILNGIKKRVFSLFRNPYSLIGLNWFEVRRLKNLPENHLNKTPFLGGTVCFYRHNEFLHSIDEIFFKEIYKTDFRGENIPYILDCGANIGMSVIYFKHKYPGARLTAFEPDNKNFEYLEKNVHSMGLKDVTLRKQAVWTENTTLKFLSEGSMSSRLETGNSFTTSTYTDVEAIRLRDLLTRKVDMLKLDIEGAEYAVLKDIEDRLFQVERIFLEYHGTFEENFRLEEMLNILSRNKFNYYITEANQVYRTPFFRNKNSDIYDIQLNIYCFK